MANTILILGGGVEQCLAIREAHKMGLRVLCIDINPQNPGMFIADRAIVGNVYNPTEAAEAAIGFGEYISGVITVAADCPKTVANVAKVMGCRGISPESAELVTDKLQMKTALMKAKVLIPDFCTLVEWEPRKHKTFVSKPTIGRGAVGVLLNQTSFGNDLIEQYIPGPQYSVEGFMIDGKGYFPAILDRNYRYLHRFAPHIIEDGGDIYLRTLSVKEEFDALMEKAALALGITDGIVKGDLVRSNEDGKLYVIEIAGRMSGGFMATVATKAALGINMVQLLIRWALGEKIKPEELEPRIDKYASIRFAFPPPGNIKSISGLSIVHSDPECEFVHCFKNPGEQIKKVKSHHDRPAVVVVSGEHIIETTRKADKLINSIRIDTK